MRKREVRGCRQTRKTNSTERKIATKETQEGCLSFLINKFSELPRSFENLLRASKSFFRRSEVLALALSLLMLAGCGGGRGGEPETREADLNAVFAGMEEACGWEEGCMAEIDGELLEEYYPGLSEVPAKQLIAAVPAMSSDVNEIVLFQGETEEDAESAAAILQARIDSQVEGGAWYAETLEAWQGSKVLRQGTYAALIASGEFQETLEEQCNQSFS